MGLGSLACVQAEKAELPPRDSFGSTCARQTYKFGVFQRHLLEMQTNYEAASRSKLGLCGDADGYVLVKVDFPALRWFGLYGACWQQARFGVGRED